MFEVRNIPDSTIYNRLSQAFINGASVYSNLYSNRFEECKAIEYARIHAVIAETGKIYKENIKVKNCNKLEAIYNAFCNVCGNKYSYQSFRIYIKDFEQNAEKYVVENRGRKEYKFDGLVEKWLLDALSSGKGYSLTYITKKISELCQENGKEAPSLSWVKKKSLKLQKFVHSGRFGEDNYTYNYLPYASMQRASAANAQWQVDGWRLPFYMEGFKTYTIFAVLDAYSKKIVGYYVAASENTETILKGIEDACRKAQSMPYEIVSDYHSFNKTAEADYFKATLKKKGCTWTVTSNPRYKSLVERHFGTFGTMFCKQQYGYIGEGVRTRRRTGRTTQELIDKYTKAGYWYTSEQLLSMAAKLVYEYNNTPTSAGTSPAQMFEENKAITRSLNAFDLAEMFIRRTEIKVSRGQITLQRGGQRYEYQLNAEDAIEYNGKKMGVRYESFEEIYLYDLKTDDFIKTIRAKQKAHGALYDQTPEDQEILFKNKGRLNGIRTQIKKKQIEIAQIAYEIDPDAAYAMNAKLTQKDILVEMKQNGELRKEAERLGVDLSKLTPLPYVDEVKTLRHDQKPNNPRKHESPFAPKETGKRLEKIFIKK